MTTASDPTGARIGSQAPALRFVSVPPRHSVSVVVYGPHSGLGAGGNRAPRTRVLDAHMPSRATRCHLCSWTVTSTSSMP